VVILKAQMKTEGQDSN